MPKLTECLKDEFVLIIDKYVNAQSSIEKLPSLVEYIPFIYSELRLKRGKRKIFDDLRKYLNDESTQDLDIPRMASRVSNGTENSGLLRSVSMGTEATGQTLTASVLLSSPQPRRLKVDMVGKQMIPGLRKQIKDKIKALENLRNGHAIGQADGILEAMLSALNCLVQIYSRIFTHIAIDMDTEQSDPKVRFFVWMATFACKYAYDYKLSNFSDATEGHQIDASYYMGTGAQNIPIERRARILEELMANLNIFASSYTMINILSILLDKQVCISDLAMHVQTLPRNLFDQDLSQELEKKHRGLEVDRVFLSTRFNRYARKFMETAAIIKSNLIFRGLNSTVMLQDMHDMYSAMNLDALGVVGFDASLKEELSIDRERIITEDQNFNPDYEETFYNDYLDSHDDYAEATFLDMISRDTRRVSTNTPNNDPLLDYVRFRINDNHVYDSAHSTPISSAAVTHEYNRITTMRTAFAACEPEASVASDAANSEATKGSQYTSNNELLQSINAKMLNKI